MKKSIQNLEKRLSKLNALSKSAYAKILDEALKIIRTKLDSNSKFNKCIQSLESSRELAGDECGWPERWIRFDASDFIDTDSSLEREVFKVYLSEYHGCYWNPEHDALLSSDGPCIVINEDGDVFDQDSGKCVIPVDDTRDEDGEISISKRNQLIEQYMESKGYFPSVVSCDRYGNMHYVNTKENAQ